MLLVPIAVAAASMKIRAAKNLAFTSTNAAIIALVLTAATETA